MGRQGQDNLVLVEKAGTLSAPVRKIIKEVSRERCMVSTVGGHDKESHDYWNDEPRHEHHRDQG